MVIQGSINSLLQTAGIAARLSPLYEKQIEKQKHNAAVKASKESIASHEKARELAIETKEGEAIQQNIADALAKEQGKLASLEPTPENIKAWAIEKSGAEIMREESENPVLSPKQIEKQKAEEAAQEALALEQERVARFNEFAKKFTEGGKYK